MPIYFLTYTLESEKWVLLRTQLAYGNIASLSKIIVVNYSFTWMSSVWTFPWLNYVFETQRGALKIRGGIFSQWSSDWKKPLFLGLYFHFHFGRIISTIDDRTWNCLFCFPLLCHTRCYFAFLKAFQRIQNVFAQTVGAIRFQIEKRQRQQECG